MKNEPGIVHAAPPVWPAAGGYHLVGCLPDPGRRVGSHALRLAEQDAEQLRDALAADNERANPVTLVAVSARENPGRTMGVWRSHATVELTLSA